MLAGIAVGGPACGSIIGIDSDKQLFPDGGTSSTSSSGGEAGPAPTTPVDSGTDTGPIDAKTCTSQSCSFGNGGPFPSPGRCDVATNMCARDCGGLSLCGKTQECPPGLNCKINCKGDSCRDVHCKGGASCTFDCTDGNCEGAICESQRCIFLCGQGNACDKAGCGGANVDCQQQCSNPGQNSKECKDGLLCCDGKGGGDDDDDLHPPPGVTRNCPAKSQCPD